MVLTHSDTTQHHGISQPTDEHAVRRSRLLPIVTAVLAAAVFVLVVRDGSFPWQVLRGMAVVSLGVIATLTIQRRSGWPRASVLFAAGCLGTAVGVGIALPHVAKAGPPLTTVAGLLALVCGLTLLVGGGVSIVRLTSGWVRVLVLPALLFAVVVALLTLGQAVAATNVPPTELASTTPADRDLRYEDVEFVTGDDVTLSGWYIPSENTAAIALLHGAGSTRSDVLDHAEALAGRGYGVLLFDARGHGRSDGRAMDFGWYGDEDVTAAVTFLTEQPEVDAGRVAVVGMSMGGEEAIGAAAADPRIAAVVAEGATNRTTADKAWLSDDYGWRGAVQERIEWLTYALTDLLTDAHQPISLREAVGDAAPRPVLLIAAGRVDAEINASRYIHGGSPDSVEVWVAPDATHTGALDRHPEEWLRRVDAFLEGALVGQ